MIGDEFSLFHGQDRSPALHKRSALCCCSGTWNSSVDRKASGFLGLFGLQYIFKDFFLQFSVQSEGHKDLFNDAE